MMANEKTDGKKNGNGNGKTETSASPTQPTQPALPGAPATTTPPVDEAALQARKAALSALSRDIQHVPFHRIELSLQNMRETLEGIDELAAAIDEQGLLENLVVWEKPEVHTLADGSEAKERYILVAGFRRHAAITKIRAKQPDAFRFVTCKIKRGNESDMIFAQLQENVQRKDFTPAELSKAMILLENRGFNRTSIARKIGKPPSYISTVMKWHESSSEALRTAVSEGAVSFTMALEIAKLPEADQAAEVERAKAEKPAGRKKAKSGAAERSRARVAAATGQQVPLGRQELRAWRDALAPGDEKGKPQEPAKGSTEYIVYRTVLGILGERPFPAKDYPRPPKSE